MTPLLSLLAVAQAQEATAQVVQPSLVKNPPVTLPPELSELGLSGRVLLELDLDETGRPYGGRVLEGLHPELDAFAVEAAMDLRFTPALVDDAPVPSTIQWAYTFQGVQPAREEQAVLVVVAEEPWREYERHALDGGSPDTPGEFVATRRDLELTAGSVSDPMRALANQPGVSAYDWLSGSSLRVRAGESGETQYVLDGVPLLRTAALGVMSIFNPTLMEKMTLSATAPSVALPEAMAGVIAADYVDPRGSQWDGTAELTLLNTSLQVGGPVGVGGVSFVAAGRVANLRPYLWLVDQSGFLGQDSYEIAYREGFARVGWDVRNQGRHYLSLTGMSTYDNISYLGAYETLVTQVESQMGTLRHQWTPGGPLSWDTSLAFSRADEVLSRSVGEESYVLTTFRPYLRTQGSWSTTPGRRLIFGSDAAWYFLRDQGVQGDMRLNGQWTTGSYTGARPPLDLGTQLDFPELAFFAEHSWAQVGGLPVDTRVGVRVTALHNGPKPVASPRLAIAYRPREGTTLKLFGGVTHQVVRDWYALHAEIGALELNPERALQASLALEQMLGLDTLLRVEGYGRRMEGLMVWSDDPAALEAGDRVQGVGSGYAYGVDALLQHRVERWGASAAYSYTRSERTNPLLVNGPQTFTPFWVAPHAVTLQADRQLGQRRRWTVAGTLAWQSGGFHSPSVTYWSAEDETWRHHFVDYSSVQMGDRTTAAVRFEHRRVIRGKVKLSTYMDLVNVRLDDNAIYYQSNTDPRDPDVAPQAVGDTGLPLLPWFGFRAEF